MQSWEDAPTCTSISMVVAVNTAKSRGTATSLATVGMSDGSGRVLGVVCGAAAASGHGFWGGWEVEQTPNSSMISLQHANDKKKNTSR